MKNQNLFRRFLFAVQGVCASWQSEKSFRLHVATFFLVACLLLITRPQPVWWALLLLTSGMMMAAELINTAIEKLLDHLHPEQHEIIRVVKDTLAGAVLVMCMVGGFVLAAFVWNIKTW